MEFHVDDNVWWEDPDDGICSGKYRVVNVNGDILTLNNEYGSEVEAFDYECDLTHD